MQEWCIAASRPRILSCKEANMVFYTTTQREITKQVAFELRDLFLQIQGENFAGRMWNEILSEDERVILGGKFADAFVNERHRAMGLYRRLYPNLSLERAMLEVTRELGWIHQAK